MADYKKVHAVIQIKIAQTATGEQNNQSLRRPMSTLLSLASTPYI